MCWTSSAEQCIVVPMNSSTFPESSEAAEIVQGNSAPSSETPRVPVDAPPSHGRGRRFNPCRAHHSDQGVSTDLGQCAPVQKNSPADWRRRIAEKSAPQPNGCIEWLATVNSSGYGVFHVRIDGRATTTGAHKASYIAHRGPVPDWAIVCHSCDNPRCVNPDHLWLGTPSDNVRDMLAKGRGVHNGGRPHKKSLAIRQRIANAPGTLIEVAAQYRVSQQTVWRYRHEFGRTRSLPTPKP